MQSITKKTLARSALMALFLTIEGVGLQMANSRLILHSPPLGPGSLAGVAVCYLVAGFTYALGFFLVVKRLPGRTPVGKGLSYSIIVLLSVWISGFISMCAIDFTGGWNLLSPAKIEFFVVGMIDCLNLMIGGLLMGIVSRRDGPAAPVAAPLTANLAARIAVAALLLPALSAGMFYLTGLVLPSGYDLAGERGKIFYAFLFAPLAIAGWGTALFHGVLRSDPRRGIIVESLKITLYLFSMYWVTSGAFALFFGFTWQVLVDFLFSIAVSLYFAIVAMETMARARPAAAS